MEREIDHLKEIHRILYLPQSTSDIDHSFTVRTIDEPYLYAEPYVYTDNFDDLNQTVSIRAANVGGGNLKISKVQIDDSAKDWIKRCNQSLPVDLTADEEADVDLTISLKELPSDDTVCTTDLNFNTNSVSDDFNKVSLGVRPSENQNIKVPNVINFGEVTARKVTFVDVNDEKKSAVFYLVGDFRVEPPTRIKIEQTDESNLHVRIFTWKRQFNYELDLSSPGTIFPRGKKNKRRSRIKSTYKTISITNVGRRKFSGKVESDVEWLNYSNEIEVGAFSTTKLSMSVEVDKLEQGRNFCQLTVGNQKSTVWVGYKVISEQIFRLSQDELFSSETDSPMQKKPLPIEVSPVERKIMLFGDLYFQFPITGKDRTGYLIGDFNDWIPRILPLKKHIDKFEATLSITDGSYFYRYEIDGEMRLDQRHLNEVVCCSHGLASRMEIARGEHLVEVENKSDSELSVRLSSSIEWLSIKKSSIILPPKETVEISTIIRPDLLQLGLNLGWIEFETRRKPKNTGYIPISIFGTTNGPVPILRNNELEFPPFAKGSKHTIASEDAILLVSLVLDIVGKGKLKSAIQPSSFFEFANDRFAVENNEDFLPAEVSLPVRIITDKPSIVHRKMCQGALITNCYLVNRRVLPLTAKFELVHLISDPPALYFPEVFMCEQQQYAIVTVRRSDGKKVKISAKIPDELGRNGALRLTNSSEKISSNQCLFVLNPQALSVPEKITGVVQLMDELSGITQPIHFAASFIASRAKIEIDTPQLYDRDDRSPCNAS